MAVENYNLKFQGYWRDVVKSGIPNNSGIYCVYTCFYDSITNKVDIDQLIYVGEAQQVRDRIMSHERIPDWQRMLAVVQEICFSFAPITPAGAREQAEAAVINFHKPPLNREYINSFPFHQTIVKTSGYSARLNSHFRVP